MKEGGEGSKSEDKVHSFSAVDMSDQIYNVYLLNFA